MNKALHLGLVEFHYFPSQRCTDLHTVWGAGVRSIIRALCLLVVIKFQSSNLVKLSLQMPKPNSCLWILLSWLHTEQQPKPPISQNRRTSRAVWQADSETHTPDERQRPPEAWAAVASHAWLFTHVGHAGGVLYTHIKHTHMQWHPGHTHTARVHWTPLGVQREWRHC